MADDLDAALSALEDSAPLTAEPHEVADQAAADPNATPDDQVDPSKAKDGDPPADDWKPPTKEHWENHQKALRAERDAAREAKRQARLYEQNVARIEQQVQDWQRQMLARQLQAPPPDPYEQPEQARAWQTQQQQHMQQLWAAEQQRQAQEAARQQQEKHFEYVNQAVDDFETEFKAQHPDYDDATDHMLGTQQKILEGMGYSPEQAQAVVADYSLRLAQQAISTGRNPAQVAYEMAKHMGYQPKGTGAQAAAEKLAAMKAGQASAQTLSGGGAGAKGGTSLKQIAGLEGAAFDSAMEKYLNDAIRGR